MLEDDGLFLMAGASLGARRSSPPLQRRAPGWADRLEFLQWLGNEMLWQLTLPRFVLAALGVWALLCRRQAQYSPCTVLGRYPVKRYV